MRVVVSWINLACFLTSIPGLALHRYKQVSELSTERRNRNAFKP